MNDSTFRGLGVLTIAGFSNVDPSINTGITTDNNTCTQCQYSILLFVSADKTERDSPEY